MVYRFGLYIIAAFLSFVLSSVCSATDEEAVSLAVDNVVYENLPNLNSDTSFTDNIDAECDSSISSDTKNRICAIQQNFSASSRSRLSIRRSSNICNIVLNGYNAGHNTQHSPGLFSHGRHASGFNEPARYLISLRKFII